MRTKQRGCAIALTLFFNWSALSRDPSRVGAHDPGSVLFLCTLRALFLPGAAFLPHPCRLRPPPPPNEPAQPTGQARQRRPQPRPAPSAPVSTTGGEPPRRATHNPSPPLEPAHHKYKISSPVSTAVTPLPPTLPDRLSPVASLTALQLATTVVSRQPPPPRPQKLLLSPLGTNP